MQRISIIMPAYNEEKRIGNTLNAYSKCFENLRKKKIINYRLLVVINNSTDKTKEIVEKYSNSNKNIKYLNLKPGGKGFAITSGFNEALEENYDLIGFVDADMATTPENYYELIKNIKDNDGIIASRGMKNSIVNTSLYRKLTNRGFNLIVRLLLQLKFYDTQCGAKIFKRKIVRKVVKSKIMTQWAFDVDLLYKLRYFKIIEFPTSWEDKGGSTIKINTPIKMFASVVRLRLIYSPFAFIIRAYDLLPERIKIHNL